MSINPLSIDNQLFRVAELALRNEERLRAWRFRYELYQSKHQAQHQTQKIAASEEKKNVSKTNT